MKKETIVAIVFGIALGLIVAFIMIINLRKFEGKNAKTITEPQLSAPASTSLSQPLVISEPQDGSITSKKTVTIKGKVQKGSLIVIESPTDQKTLKNTKTADFSVDFPLAFGENIINVSVFPSDPKLSFQQKIIKVYSLDEQ